MMYPFVMIVIAVFGSGLGEYDTREEHIYYGTMKECEDNMKLKEEQLMSDPEFKAASITCKSR